MSFQDIVVGVDLSAAAERALMQALRLARHCGARVSLVHVGPVPERGDGVPESTRTTADTLRAVMVARLAEDRAHLEALRQRLLGQGVELSHVVVDGFADAAIADTARELNADLIVVGSHGRTGLARVLLGSVAEKTVRFASASVLVARGGDGVAEGGFRRIVVGTDFSALADGAIARALEVAAAGADLHIVHAWHVPPAIGPETVVAVADLRDALADDAERRAGEVLRTWKGRGRDVRFHVETVEAPPQQALVERAEALGADLIVVGSHGRRGLRRLVLGSVAETTVRHAPCSVLVAR